MIRASRLALLLCASLGAAAHAQPADTGSSGAQATAPQPTDTGRHHRRSRRERQAAIAPTRLTTIGINAYLWRAALDTISFMTIAQSDSNGGVLTTEWYVNPTVPGERMKVSVSILDQDLRADAVRVAAARQVLQNGQWTDTSVQASTNQRLEEIILEKARTLRRNATAG